MVGGTPERGLPGTARATVRAMRLGRRLLLGGLPALVAVACLSPTLPLPPPSPPDVQQIGVGQYRLQGTIPFAGTVLVLDRRTRLVYGKVVSDVYTLDVTGDLGDDMVLWYEVGQDVSDVTEFTLDPDEPALTPDAGTPSSPDAGTGPRTDAGSRD